jgi:amino acid adenylation domain-containing protein
MSESARNSGRLAGGLSADRQALLDRILRKKGIQARGPEPLPRRPRPDEPAPLSFAQRRLWLLERMNPWGNAYNVPGAVRLAGRLDVAALAGALAEIGRRHEILRTRFALLDGEPVQIVAQEPDLPLPLVDLSALPGDLRAAEAARLAREEVRRPFDLERGPFLRALLIRQAAAEHLFVYTLHHIASDGWSRGVLVRELVALYSAFSEGRPSPLPSLPVQYADFAVWQRRHLEGERLEKLLGWWRERLAGAPPALDLPADRRRPAVRTSRGGVRPVAVPAERAAGLQALARAEGATPFMVLLAAYGVLLGRLAGEEDVVVGTAVAGRDRPELEGLIGFFVNTLALRVDLSGDPPFRELLSRVSRSTLGAFEHQEIPFERLVEDLAPERDPSRHPLFQVAFGFQNTPDEAHPATLPGGLVVSPVGTESGTAKFDLTLSLNEAPEGLTGFLELSADLFEPPTADRFLRAFQTLLEGIAADPGRNVSELSLLAPEERDALTVQAGPLRTGLPVWCLHERFEEQARRAPDAVAVVHEGESLTYAELDRRASALAAHLEELGVGPEVLVGVFLERSLEMIVALLGVLKAGGAYLPLDPSYPGEHTAFVLRDAGVWAVVTARALEPALPAHGAELVFVEDFASLEDFSSPGGGALSREAGEGWGGGAHPAYVIYTSGSTGRPKGVLVTHACASRLFEATQERYAFGPFDVWTLFHSYAFDFSVWEIWGALCYGGRLVVVPHLVTRSPGDFLQLLARERVTVLNQTPSAFRQLVRAETTAEPPVPLPDLRLVIFGGEALDFAALAPWFERHPERPELVNMYGITETTVHVTWAPVGPRDAVDPERAGRSVIGEPIPDLQLHLLDRRLQTVPVGVPGEIFVGGPGLARG